MWELALAIGALGVTSLFALEVFGRFRWAEQTHTLRTRLESAHGAAKALTVDSVDVEGLPVPVQRYLQKALGKGAPLVTGVRVRHEGEFNLSETADRWKPFRSDQQVTIQPPGFDWDAKVRLLPGVTIRVHDAYVAGQGLLHAAVLGLFPVVSLQGTHEIAQGQLMRFLAEAAWYPTALLPSQGIHWTAVDSRSAQVTLTDGSVAVTMRFRFNEEDLIEEVQADARGRTVGKQVVPTPWRGRLWNYRELAGMLIPLEGEVAWLLPEGAKPYWRGRITSIDYQFAKQE